MSEFLPQSSPITEVLTRDLAEKHLESLTELANLIPGVEYSPEDILAEQKGDRKMHGKWEHSLIALEGGEAIGFLMAYEREAEGNQQYPDNTLYLSELAVAESHQGQGIAKELLKEFFETSNRTGFVELTGDLSYSVQTNSAEWNSRVIDLYKSFGFEQRATKEYPNRTDIVLGAKSSEIII